jgi:hypothetical protein
MHPTRRESETGGISPFALSASIEAPALDEGAVIAPHAGRRDVRILRINVDAADLDDVVNQKPHDAVARPEIGPPVAAALMTPQERARLERHAEQETKRLGREITLGDVLRGGYER